MHFSSQHLNQGVKIFQFFFLIVFIFIVCLEKGQKKKKAALKLPWVASSPGCVCTNPSPCCKTLTAPCLPVLDRVGLSSQGRGDFFTCLSTFSPEGTTSLFPWLWEGTQMSSESTTLSGDVLGHFELDLMFTSAVKTHTCFS